MARLPPVASASGVRVDILGPLRLERDGEPVELSGGRLRALLTRLALDAGRPVTTSALVDAVWDNDLPSDEQHALQSLVSRLRRSVGDVLEATPGGYRLAVAPTPSTRRASSALVAEGRPREALALWRGPSGIAAARGRAPARAAGARRRDAPGARGRARRAPAQREARRPPHHRARRRRPPGRCARRPTSTIRIRLDEELGAAPSPELAEAHLAVLKAPGPARRATCARRSRASSGARRRCERIDELLAHGAAGHARRPGRGRQDAARRRGARALGGPRRRRRLDGRAGAGHRRGRDRPRRAGRARPARRARCSTARARSPRDGLERLLDALDRPRDDPASSTTAST